MAMEYFASNYTVSIVHHNFKPLTLGSLYDTWDKGYKLNHPDTLMAICGQVYSQSTGKLVKDVHVTLCVLPIRSHEPPLGLITMLFGERNIIPRRFMFTVKSAAMFGQTQIVLIQLHDAQQERQLQEFSAYGEIQGKKQPRVFHVSVPSNLPLNSSHPWLTLWNQLPLHPSPDTNPYATLT